MFNDIHRHRQDPPAYIIIMLALYLELQLQRIRSLYNSRSNTTDFVSDSAQTLASHSTMSVCSSCSHPYNLMIRFECNHLYCVSCFQGLPSTTLPVKCCECHKPTQTFQYKFQKVLACDKCSEPKAVDDFWW